MEKRHTTAVSVQKKKCRSIYIIENRIQNSNVRCKCPEKFQASNGIASRSRTAKESGDELIGKTNMATVSVVLDDLIKEYLLFRGFTSTLKAFENDIKADKDKSYRVSNINEKSDF